jgi:hypothetical protein
MIYTKLEGEPPRQGLNIYPSTDPYSAGFEIRIWRGVLSVRYSKIVKHWKIRAYWMGGMSES